MIKVNNLCKKYKDKVAVDNISFNVKKGTITGFIGENGAGKSTTLRCILGLTKPTSGEVTILDTEYKNLKNPSKAIGVVLDASKLNQGRTGYSILKVASTISEVSTARIDDVLNECGLTPKEGRKKIKSYSLGMRQRLCIAQALLTNPDILILDEPVNGLDPRGIIWIRTILKKFADNGGTVLLSSHLLSEIEKIADHIVMISNGRIIANDSIFELLKDGSNLEEVYINHINSFAKEVR